MIDALPEIIILENKEDVEAARAAYEALTKEQKALVVNLAVLEAAETAIEELLEGSSGPEIEIPEETCTVDYKEMSDGVSYESVFSADKRCFDITITIGEVTDTNVVIDLSQIVLNALDRYAADHGKNSYSVQPGDSILLHITVMNKSGHTYQYKDGSFVLSTANAHAYEQSMFLGYDGQLIPVDFLSHIQISHKAIYKNLFGVSESGNVTAEMVFGLYDILAEKGYSGSDALTTFMLGYFNDYYNADYQTFEELAAAKPNLGDQFAQPGVNGIFELTHEKLAQYKAEHPEMVPYLHITDDNGETCDVQFYWPEESLAAVSYNIFYQEFFSAAFGDEVSQMNPNWNTTFTRTRGIGDYMSGSTLSEQADQYFASLIQDGSTNADKHMMEFDMILCVDGPGVGNGYMNYDFAFYNVIELEQQDTSYQVVHEYYTKKDGKYTLDGQFISDAVDAMVGDQVNAADLEKLTGYSGKTYTYVSANPATLAITSDADKNVLTLRYEREEKKEESSEPEESYPPRPDPDPSDPDEEIPDESTPTTSGPDGEVVPEGPGGDGEEIPDESTPLTSVPTEDIDDEETPVTAPPKTGSAATSASLILAAASALGLVLLRKKK